MLSLFILGLFAQSVVFGQGCRPGELPAFHFGFAQLQDVVGSGIVGQPVTCEFPITTSGDVAQGTTTGLAYYRKSINAPIFYDPNIKRHWALIQSGIAVWDTPEVDPPIGAFLLPYDWECSIGIPIGDYIYKRCPS